MTAGTSCFSCPSDTVSSMGSDDVADCLPVVTTGSTVTITVGFTLDVDELKPEDITGLQKSMADHFGVDPSQVFLTFSEAGGSQRRLLAMDVTATVYAAPDASPAEIAALKEKGGSVDDNVVTEIVQKSSPNLQNVRVSGVTAAVVEPVVEPKKEEEEGDDSLSSGAVAGIVIGSIICAGLFVFVLWRTMRKEQTGGARGDVETAKTSDKPSSDVSSPDLVFTRDQGQAVGDVNVAPVGQFSVAPVGHFGHFGYFGYHHHAGHNNHHPFTHQSSLHIGYV